jgi:hypothetical protein
VFEELPRNRKASLVIDIVPLAVEVVSVAIHWSPVKVVVLDPESSEKFSRKIVVWADALDSNATPKASARSAIVFV